MLSSLIFRGAGEAIAFEGFDAVLLMALLSGHVERDATLPNCYTGQAQMLCNVSTPNGK